MKKRVTASRQLIMQTARTLAKKEGWDAVSVRKVADQMQYTAPIIYEFFENREDLIAQIIEEGVQILRGRFAAVWAAGDRRSLVPLAVEYWEFAQNHYEIYSAMNLFPNFKKEHAGIAEQAGLFCGEIATMIALWADQHRIKTIDAGEASDILWAHMHGLAHLGLSGQLGVMPRVKHLIVQSVVVMEKGFAAV